MRQKSASATKNLGSGKLGMTTEYSAPAIKEQMRSMLGEGGRLLAPGETLKAQITQLALCLRRHCPSLTTGRIKRILYDEVRTVEAGEFSLVNDWLIPLRARLAPLEQQYAEARKEALEAAPGSMLAAALPAREGRSRLADQAAHAGAAAPLSVRRRGNTAA